MLGMARSAPFHVHRQAQVSQRFHPLLLSSAFAASHCHDGPCADFLLSFENCVSPEQAAPSSFFTSFLPFHFTAYLDALFIDGIPSQKKAAAALHKAKLLSSACSTPLHHTNTTIVSLIMSFAVLPRELQTRILLYALEPANASSQAAVLALVSRNCNAIITPLLYRHVRVTTPSMLRSIHAAVQAKPALAKLVQSIHIGPDSELLSQGWPLVLEEEEGGGSILALMPTLDKSLLPIWVQPGLAFDIHCPHDLGCKDFAIHRAIRRALEDLDVKAIRRGWSESGRKIGIRAWASRLWSVQAALDLYLVEMKKKEEAGNYDVQAWDKEGEPESSLTDLDEKCKESTCGHYPALSIKKHKTSSISNEPQPASEQGVQQLRLTEQQLWNHLARRGGPADHFNHLLHLTRCTRLGLQMGGVEWVRLRNDLGGPHWLAFRNEDYRAMMKEKGIPRGEDDIRDDEASVRTFSEDSNEEYWDDRGEEAPAEAGGDHAEELLRIAREILAATTRVTNVSLTGFFHRSLGAVQGSEQVPSLSLGPIPRWWQHVLSPLSPGNSTEGKTGCDSDSDSDAESEDSYAKARLCAVSVDGTAKMPSLRRLRVCGEMSSRDAAKIATQMPALRTVIWEMTNQEGYMDE